MKMVKSLLLGSAAGLMAVAGAQAADLPVKAAPVEYVKVCSLYGAGFWYIPGTDICVKIGGFVRGQYYYGQGTSPSNMIFGQNSINTQNTRAVGGENDFVMRARAIITMDTRAQTEWGTVRTYMNVGLNYDSGSMGYPGVITGAGNITSSLQNTSTSAIYANRAFIQWAGFTFGRTQSFWDVAPTTSFAYNILYFSDTSDQGINTAAYTTQWGNGLSSTIAIEDPRRFAIYNTDQSLINSGLIAPGVLLNNDQANIRWPDVVSNWRIDQAWGSFQVMSALHDASAAYFFAPCNAPGNPGNNQLIAAQPCGYPDDKLGWAAGVGAIINLPWIAQGDRFSFQVNYAKGAVRYLWFQNGSNPGAYFGGNYSLGLLAVADGVLRDPGLIGGAPRLGGGGTLELTSGWAVFAAFEHLWTPALKTSWYGGGFQLDYNSNATNYICGVVGQAAGVTLPPAAGAIGNFNNGNPAGCNPNSGIWYAGTRTQWNIRPDFYMGVDLMYQRLDTSFAGFASYLSNTARPNGGTPFVAGANGVNGPFYQVKDQDALSVTFRVHRDIVP